MTPPAKRSVMFTVSPGLGLFVLAHNLLRMAVLAPQLIGWGTDPSAMAAQAA